jgi:hypothetical protein
LALLLSNKRSGFLNLRDIDIADNDLRAGLRKA